MADARPSRWFGIVEEGIAGPYLLGDSYSIADVYLTMLMRWGRGMSVPPKTEPRLAALAEKVLERPAVQKAIATEGIQAPFLG